MGEGDGEGVGDGVGDGMGEGSETKCVLGRECSAWAWPLMQMEGEKGGGSAGEEGSADKRSLAGSEGAEAMVD